MSNPEVQAATTETLTTAQVETVYGINAGTLKQWRYRGQGPRFFKATPGPSGLVLYRRDDIEAWIGERVEATTAKAA